MGSNQQVTPHTVLGGDGIRLYVEEKGNPNGIPLLFIHGFNQCRLVWEKQTYSDLAEEFRIVIMDNRGHGLSEKPRDAYHHSALWANDIQAVIEALHLKRAVLIGWSYGGMVIFDYLRYFGEEKISGINLVGARSRIGVPETLEETGKEYLLIRQGLFSNDINEGISAIERFIRLCTVRQPSPKDLYFFLGFNAIVPPYVRQGLMSRSLSNEDLLPTLKKPVLITHGIEDQIVLLRHAQYNASIANKVNTSFYEKVGHNSFWEDSERFNNELRAFANSIA